MASSANSKYPQYWLPMPILFQQLTTSVSIPNFPQYWIHVPTLVPLKERERKEARIASAEFMEGERKKLDSCGELCLIPLSPDLKIEQPDEAFQNVFRKEKPGRVLCHGRVTTPTLLKRTEEITKIEKKHADELKVLNDKVLEMEAKHNQKML
ncbi:hypothetical protein Lal_00013401 [Lupinus albus]|nr:hypothetical protein Lal_00013401 [Lupinus albus]